MTKEYVNFVFGFLLLSYSKIIFADSLFKYGSGICDSSARFSLSFRSCLSLVDVRNNAAQECSRYGLNLLSYSPTACLTLSSVGSISSYNEVDFTCGNSRKIGFGSKLSCASSSSIVQNLKDQCDASGADTSLQLIYALRNSTVQLNNLCSLDASGF